MLLADKQSPSNTSVTKAVAWALLAAGKACKAPVPGSEPGVPTTAGKQPSPTCTPPVQLMPSWPVPSAPYTPAKRIQYCTPGMGVKVTVLARPQPALLSLQYCMVPPLAGQLLQMLMVLLKLSFNMPHVLTVTVPVQVAVYTNHTSSVSPLAPDGELHELGVRSPPVAVAPMVLNGVRPSPTVIAPLHWSLVIGAAQLTAKVAQGGGLLGSETRPQPGPSVNTM